MCNFVFAERGLELKKEFQPMPRRDPLPDDLKELLTLCRAGKLFAVQKWIHAVKRYRSPPGNFSTTPFQATVEMGFHSLIEVFLRAGIGQDEMDRGLRRVVSDSRLDLVELFVEYGADLTNVSTDIVIETRDMAILRWFIDRGLDLETGFPIAEMFRNMHREFLGLYLNIADRIPSARMQAAMALCHHAREGNMKWVCLLLWAGADPRMRVPDLDYIPYEGYRTTAVLEAVRNERIEIVRKFKIDPTRDDASALLARCWGHSNPDLVELLLDAGADPNANVGGETPMLALLQNFESSLESDSWRRTPEKALRCIELAAARGGRWNPTEPHEFRGLRTALGRAPRYRAIRLLNQLVNSGVFEQPVFREFMDTARMKQLLAKHAPGVYRLREFAGVVARPRPTRTRKNRTCYTQVAEAGNE